MNFNPRRVLAYARVSSSEQGERGTSLEAQQEEFARFCKASGFPKPRVYVEVEGGGQEKLEKRLELHRLLRDVTDGDLVVCVRQDRWSRYTLFYLQSVEQIVAKGARFFSITERFDPSTPEGKFAATTMANVAELEHARIKDRTVGSRKRLRRMGAYVEGGIPLGYAIDRKARKLVQHETNAAIVRSMFAMAIDGKSTREISFKLEADFPGTGGLDPAAIARKLRNRIYLGEMRAAAKKGEKPKPGDEWLQSHEPIVDRITFARVQKALTTRRSRGRAGDGESRTADFLLRGLARCGACGYVLVSHAPSPKDSVTHGGYYLCRKRLPDDKRCAVGPTIRHKDLDESVNAAALKHLETMLAKLSKGDTKRALHVVPDFEKRRAALLKRQKNVVDAISNGTIRTEIATRTLDEIASGIEAIERSREDYEASTKTTTPAAKKAALANIKSLRDAWDAITISERREALGRMIDKLIVHSTPRPRWQRAGTWTHEITWKKF